MLHSLAPDLWHVPHKFAVLGMPVSTRMTVVRLRDGRLWLHSPVPLAADLREQLAALGEVAFVVAPNRHHHLFALDAVRAFPGAQLYGPQSLRKKRPDLTMMKPLPPEAMAEWADDLGQVFFEGIPVGDETVWFHKSSGTLILTDLCQQWEGDLGWQANLYARLTGVRDGLAVPRTIRLAVKDRALARRSAERILQWPIQRVVMAHNSVIDKEAMPQVRAALGWFGA